MVVVVVVVVKLDSVVMQRGCGAGDACRGCGRDGDGGSDGDAGVGCNLLCLFELCL
jgi:hypothetical protein